MNTPAPGARLVARVDSVTKSFGVGSNTVTALDSVSLGIRAGEFTAVMGPSGSGKSTLMHIMAGLDTPTTGRVWFGDTDITGLDDSALTHLFTEGLARILGRTVKLGAAA